MYSETPCDAIARYRGLAYMEVNAGYPFYIAHTDTALIVVYRSALVKKTLHT
jgi:hypothetical protein